MIQIKRWTDGKVLYTAENATDVRTALEEAVKAKANLGYANLGYANLGYANLGYANLGYADLGYANLGYANLGYADLGYADLGYANLGYADLGYANLGYANLGYANLGYADLGYAHALWSFWMDFCSVLDQTPAEVAGLRAAIVEGNIDGSTYSGSCACLVGTIAKVRHVSVESLNLADSTRPAEQWFMPIRKADVPLDDPSKAGSEGVFRASVALKWIDEWRELRLTAAKALAA